MRTLQALKDDWPFVVISIFVLSWSTAVSGVETSLDKIHFNVTSSENLGKTGSFDSVQLSAGTPPLRWGNSIPQQFIPTVNYRSRSVPNFSGKSTRIEEVNLGKVYLSKWNSSTNMTFVSGISWRQEAGPAWTLKERTFPYGVFLANFDLSDEWRVSLGMSYSSNLEPNQLVPVAAYKYLSKDRRHFSELRFPSLVYFFEWQPGFQVGAFLDGQFGFYRLKPDSSQASMPDAKYLRPIDVTLGPALRKMINSYSINISTGVTVLRKRTEYDASFSPLTESSLREENWHIKIGASLPLKG